MSGEGDQRLVDLDGDTHAGCPALAVTDSSYTLLDLWASVWRGARATVSERLALPLRFLAAFDAIDAEMAGDGNA